MVPRTNNNNIAASYMNIARNNGFGSSLTLTRYTHNNTLLLLLLLLVVLLVVHEIYYYMYVCTLRIIPYIVTSTPQTAG